jgi:hypothetical protein
MSLASNSQELEETQANLEELFDLLGQEGENNPELHSKIEILQEKKRILLGRPAQPIVSESKASFPENLAAHYEILKFLETIVSSSLSGEEIPASQRETELNSIFSTLSYHSSQLSLFASPPIQNFLTTVETELNLEQNGLKLGPLGDLGAPGTPKKVLSKAQRRRHRRKGKNSGSLSSESGGGGSFSSLLFRIQPLRNAEIMLQEIQEMSTEILQQINRADSTAINTKTNLISQSNHLISSLKTAISPIEEETKSPAPEPEELRPLPVARVVSFPPPPPLDDSEEFRPMAVSRVTSYPPPPPLEEYPEEESALDGYPFTGHSGFQQQFKPPSGSPPFPAVNFPPPPLQTGNNFDENPNNNINQLPNNHSAGFQPPSSPPPSFSTTLQFSGIYSPPPPPPVFDAEEQDRNNYVVNPLYDGISAAPLSNEQEFPTEDEPEEALNTVPALPAAASSVPTISSVLSSSNSVQRTSKVLELFARNLAAARASQRELNDEGSEEEEAEETDSALDGEGFLDFGGESGEEEEAGGETSQEEDQDLEAILSRAAHNQQGEAGGEEKEGKEHGNSTETAQENQNRSKVCGNAAAAAAAADDYGAVPTADNGEVTNNSEHNTNNNINQAANNPLDSALLNHNHHNNSDPAAAEPSPAPSVPLSVPVAERSSSLVPPNNSPLFVRALSSPLDEDIWGGLFGPELIEKYQINYSVKEISAPLLPAAAMKSFYQAQETKETPAIAHLHSAEEGEILCFSCFDPIPLNSPYFRCENSLEHSQCAQCFGDYIKHCCSNYYEGKFPIKCATPGCNLLLSEQILRSLLGETINAGLYTVYLNCCVTAGLLDLAENSENKPVSCPKCNTYTVLMPKNYKQRASRLKLLQMEEEKEEKLENQSKTGQIHENTRKTPSNSQFKRSGRVFELMAQFEEREKQASEEKKLSEQQKIRGTAVKVQANLQDLKQEEQRRRLKKTLQNELADSSEIPSKMPSIQREPSTGVLTSLFFECLLDNCGAVSCLRCDFVLENMASTANHQCIIDQLADLQLELADLLAEASVTRCPSCNKPTQKDLACTHMTCGACKVRYCYICGQGEINLGSFGTHNTDWTLLSPDNRCPMYLNYCWGAVDAELSNLRENKFHNGDPTRSLMRFHLLKQRKALENYEMQLNKEALDLWRAMKAKFFPRGLWDPAEEAIVDKILAWKDTQKLKLASERANLAAAQAEEQRVEALRLERIRRAAEEQRMREEVELRAAERRREEARIAEQLRVEQRMAQELAEKQRRITARQRAEAEAEQFYRGLSVEEQEEWEKNDKIRLIRLENAMKAAENAEILRKRAAEAEARAKEAQEEERKAQELAKLSSVERQRRIQAEQFKELERQRAADRKIELLRREIQETQSFSAQLQRELEGLRTELQGVAHHQWSSREAEAQRRQALEREIIQLSTQFEQSSDMVRQLTARRNQWLELENQVREEIKRRQEAVLALHNNSNAAAHSNNNNINFNNNGKAIVANGHSNEAKEAETKQKETKQPEINRAPVNSSKAPNDDSHSNRSSALIPARLLLASDGSHTNPLSATQFEELKVLDRSYEQLAERIEQAENELQVSLLNLQLLSNRAFITGESDYSSLTAQQKAVSALQKRLDEMNDEAQELRLTILRIVNQY